MTTRASAFGERALSTALYVLGGALVGTMGTFVHRARFDLAGQPVWFGVVLAVVAVASLGVGIRMYLNDRWGAYCYLAGVVASVGFLAFLTPGLSAIVLGDAVGFGWLVASTLIATIVACWPEVPSRRSPRGPRATSAVAPDAGSGAPSATVVGTAPGAPGSSGAPTGEPRNPA